MLLYVMTYIELKDVLNFMFFVNKDSRNFLYNNWITIKNEFVNEGLITHILSEVDFYIIE
jgi:hypothetical protein